MKGIDPYRIAVNLTKYDGIAPYKFLGGLNMNRYEQINTDTIGAKRPSILHFAFCILHLKISPQFRIPKSEFRIANSLPAFKIVINLL